MHRNTRPKRNDPNDVRCASCTLPVSVAHGEPTHIGDVRDGELYYHRRCWTHENRALRALALAS
jgi:hypothetical protein